MVAPTELQKMGYMGGGKWLHGRQHRFTSTKVFIRVRVGTIEQGIILKGFEEHLKYNWGPEEEGRFKDKMKVFQHREYGTIWGKKKVTGKKVD